MTSQNPKKQPVENQKDFKANRHFKLILGGLIALQVVGVLALMLASKSRPAVSGTDTDSSIFPYWLIILIPIILAKKKKKAVSKKEQKTIYLVMICLALLVLLLMVFFLFHLIA